MTRSCASSVGCVWVTGRNTAAQPGACLPARVCVRACWHCAHEAGGACSGYYTCNKYNPGACDEARRESAKSASQRYMHYYVRWMNHGLSMNIANEGQRVTVEAKRHALSLKGYTLNQTDFLNGVPTRARA